MKIGIKTSFGSRFRDIKEQFRDMTEMGIFSCQLGMGVDAISRENADYILEGVKETGVEISGVWAYWSAPCEWNFTMGPETIGLVPTAYRGARLKEMLGVQNMITHVGFLPENMNDPLFSGTIGALRHLCKVMKNRGQNFLFETGQETPVTLLRAIEAIGTGNVGVNLDTANLILYGKANPVGALDVIGDYVLDTHCKDGFYPTNGNELGEEVRMGDGKVDFYAFVKGLHEHGYKGPLTIEREITGDEQVRDIISAKKYLEDIKKDLGIE